MKILSLFDGMACGHIAFNVAGLDVESYDAYEIDKYAIKVATTNFPDIKEHGDVFKEDFTKYKGNVDFVVGGSPCFTAGHLILTDKGYKPIEKICCGDMVLTHKNRFRTVLATGDKIAAVCKLRVGSTLELIGTPNHPFPTRTLTESGLSEIERVDMKELIPGKSYLGVPSKYYSDSGEHILDDSTGHVWIPVMSVSEPIGEETVYNMTVDEDHSYTVNNVCAFNCTYWSIAQSPDKRETVASGMGWDLFSQYVRAVKEAEPRFFIYENNKSMSPEIRKSISETFGFEPIHINSALVSAQKRDRLYWVGIRNEDGTYRKAKIEQPEDKGILLKDILDGMAGQDKARTVTASVGRTTLREYLPKHQNTMAAEPVPKPSCIGNIPNEQGELVDHQATRIYDVDGKSICLKANGGGQGAKTGLYAEPVEPIPIHDTTDGKPYCLIAHYMKEGISNMTDGTGQNATAVAELINTTEDGKAHTLRADDDKSVECVQRFEVNTNSDKSNCLTTVGKDNAVLETVPINLTKEGDKAQCLRANYYKVNDRDIIGNDVDHRTGAVSPVAPTTTDAYEVKDGQITYKGKKYPIKLADGWYRIRKLSVNECKRLQTVPEWYDMTCISKTQAYKCLGNGWTVDVIVHLIRSALADN